jgi:hypothetical protein
LGPLFARRDAAADQAGAAGTGREAAADEEPADAGKEPAGAGREAADAGKEPAGAGKETADAGKEAGVKAEEADEEEEAAPSPWSIPLTLVGDVSDLEEEDDGQPAGSGAAEEHGTGKPPPAGEGPAPERAGSDVWTRSSWARAEEKQAGPAKADGGDGSGEPDKADRAGAGRGPWLTRPGKGATADLAGPDAGEAAAAHADDKAGAADDRAGADDDATAGRTAHWTDALPIRVGQDDLPTRVGRDDLPTRAGRDEMATPAGGQAGADSHAKATSAGRDADAGALPTRAGRDDVATRAGSDAGANDRVKATAAGRDTDADGDAVASRPGRDGTADDEAKATDATRGDGDAASRTAAHTQAGTAAGTSAATAGSARTPGDAKPPSEMPTEKPTLVQRPSATLFQPTTSAPPDSSAGQVAGKTAGPATQRDAPSPAEGAGARAPAAGSGTGTTGAGPAPARDGDERGATKQGGAGPNGSARAADGNAVVIVPGIARYHRTGCILIRFLGSDDLETSTAQEAQAKGCAPCRACEPDKLPSSGG